MKRICSFFLCVVLVMILIVPASAQIRFSDVDDDHWAAEDIYILVQEGIINGYEDGTFRPDSYVNRAEFAKLVGPANVTNDIDFQDVSEEHWAYPYVMSSAINAGDKFFYPEQFMTRGDICEILYSRHGENIKLIVPDMITYGDFDTDAVSWAYSTGLMIGDDGINLRLSDPVTRAEAVLLIQRAKSINNNSFKTVYDLADAETLAYIFNGADIFDDVYLHDTKFTNGELAQAALRFGYSHEIPDYIYSVKSPFEGEYALDLSVLCNKVWGMDNCNDEFCNSYATVQNTLSALMFGYMTRINDKTMNITVDSLYHDYVDKNGTSFEKMLLSTANSNGIVIDGENLDSERIATHKDVAIILLQLNHIAGLENKYADENKSAKVRTNITSISEETLENYLYLLDEVPNVVYETPLNALYTCKETTRFMRSYSSVFTFVMDTLKKSTNSKGYNVDMVFYPSMVALNGGSYIARIRMVPVEDVPLKDIIADCDNNVVLKSGNTYFIDIDTCADLADMLSEIPNLKVINVITV